MKLMLTSQSDGSKCSTFIFDAKVQGSNGRLPLARNMASKLKTLRFPGIIKYLDSSEVCKLLAQCLILTISRQIQVS